MRLRKQQRLALVILAVLLVGGAAGLVLAALQDKVAFFVTPTQVAEQALEPGRRFRLGGLVVDLRDVPLKLPDRSDLRG